MSPHTHLNVYHEDRDNKCWQQCGGKGTLHIVGADAGWSNTMQNNMEVFKKLKIELPYAPAILLKVL